MHTRTHTHPSYTVRDSSAVPDVESTNTSTSEADSDRLDMNVPFRSDETRTVRCVRPEGPDSAIEKLSARIRDVPRGGRLIETR